MSGEDEGSTNDKDPGTGNGDDGTDDDESCCDESGECANSNEDEDAHFAGEGEASVGTRTPKRTRVVTRTLTRARAVTLYKCVVHVLGLYHTCVAMLRIDIALALNRYRIGDT